MSDFTETKVTSDAKYTTITQRGKQVILDGDERRMVLEELLAAQGLPLYPVDKWMELKQEKKRLQGLLENASDALNIIDGLPIMEHLPESDGEVFAHAMALATHAYNPTGGGQWIA